MNYKAETTLNERDALTDIYLTLQHLLKTYADAYSKATSKGFLKTSREAITLVGTDRLDVFSLLCERDYMGVNSAEDERQEEIINRFIKRINNLN